MDLTDDEIRDLAAFLARRVTPDGQRPDPTDAPAAGRTPLQAWQERLSSAREAAGGVARVVREAAAAAPEDRELQEACALLARAPRRSARWPAIAAGVVGAVALAAVLAVGVSAREAEAFVAAAPAAADAATSSGDDGPDALAPRVTPGLPALGAATRVPRVEDGPPEGPTERSACAGWFYVGRRAPEPTHVVERRTHVRAVHPSRENGWNREGRVTCVLERGQRVALAGAPV